MNRKTAPKMRTWTAPERFKIASQADRCVSWLRAQGFTVLSIGAGPCITVRLSPLCNQLEGAAEGYSRTGSGETRYQTVNRFDCEVCWVLSETPAKRPAVSLWQAVMARLNAWGEA